MRGGGVPEILINEMKFFFLIFPSFIFLIIYKCLLFIDLLVLSCPLIKNPLYVNMKYCMFNYDEQREKI